MPNIHAGDIKRKITSWKKAYLTNVGNVAMLLYCSLAAFETMSRPFKEQRQIEDEKGFMNSHVTPYKTPNGHASSLKEMIIYCTPALDIKPVLFLLDKYTINRCHCSLHIWFDSLTTKPY